MFLLNIPLHADQDPVDCRGSGLGIALFVDKPQAHVGDTLYYSALVYNNPFPACKASEIQAWITTPDGVKHSINLRRTVLRPGESDTYDNVATYVIRAQDIVNGIVKGAANDMAKIHQNITLSDGEAAQTVNTIIVNPCISITASCSDGVGQDGQISYSGTVQNCGDVSLSNVTVTNTVDGIARRVFGPVTLAVGQSATFSGSYKPANPCNPSTAVFFAAGADTMKQPKTVTANTSATCSIATTPAIAMGQSCPTVTTSVGGQLTYSGSVTNTGNVTLTNVVVTSDQPAPGTVIYTLASLAPKAVANFTARFTAPANACNVTISLGVNARSICGQAVSANSSSTCPLVSKPSLALTQNCPANPVAPGETLTYSGTVKNTGDITLKDVVVTSSAAPGVTIFSIPSLDPGVVMAFSGSFTTPADTCSVTNTLSATAKDVCQNQAASTSVTTVCPLTTAPAITITQSCPAVTPGIGGTLTYSGTVQNNGNVTLLNVSVVSERPNNGVVFTAARLAPGASTNFTASYTIPANYNGCSITNTLKVAASDKCTSRQVTANVTTTCLVQSSPKIRITAACPTIATAPGGKLTYSGTVSNPGDVALKNVKVLANQPAINTVVYSVESLAPGASANFTGSYTAPLDACSSTVVLSVSATDSCAGSTISDSVTQTCPLTSAPSIAVTLDCPSTPTAPGKPLVFTGKITNTGIITLTNATVVVNRPNANSPVFGPVILAPGASMNFSGSFIVPLDLNSCSITSTVTARGNSQCDGASATASASATCPVSTSPAILLTTACPGTATPQGSSLTFSGTVQNLGNIALTNVVIVNNRPTNNTPVARFSLLYPGQSTNFTGSFVVPVNCCELVSTLTVTATDLCGTSNLVDTSTLICPVKYTPAVKISRACPTETLEPGDKFTFNGAITNSGNITLTKVVVTSAYLGAGSPLLGPIDLAPGESVPYTGSFIVTGDFCGVDTTTVTAYSICGESVKDSITTTCSIKTAPGIAVINIPAGSASGCSVNMGRGTVANTGNVTLTDIYIYCNQPAANTLVLGPITLASGASTNFSYSFSAPSQCNCCELSITLSAAGKGKCDGKQVTHSSTLVVPVITSPKITVGLDCSNAKAGIVRGIVKNAGDVALSNVSVTSSLPSAGTVVLPTINLAPGETKYFTFDPKTADTATLLAMSVVATGKNICGGGTVTATASCINVGPKSLDISRNNGQSIMLKWNGIVGAKYLVQYKKSLQDNDWSTLEGVVETGESNMQTFKADSTASDGVRIYRVIEME